MEIPLIIGFDNERAHPQNIYIDIFCTIEEENFQDNLDKTFDYRNLVEVVKQMKTEELYTIEGLAYKIIEKVKVIKKIQKVEVYVRKHPGDIGLKLDYSEVKVEG